MATAYLGDTVQGPLSVDEATYIRVSLRNAGLGSVPNSVEVSLYYDDSLVSISTWSGLLADRVAKGLPWDELPEARDIKPGEHTLRLEIDANNLVAESDETNNTFEKTFTWEEGPVPPRPEPTLEPEPTPPSPPALPNLVPGWRYGEDGPIVVSHLRDTTLDAKLTVDQTPYVDVAIRNLSSVDAVNDFDIELYFDGRLVHTFPHSDRFPGANFLRVIDWPNLADEASVTPGTHTLRLVIDPDNRVLETNEADNSFEKTYYWGIGPVVEPAVTVYTDDDLHRALADIRELLDVEEPALDESGRDATQRVREIAAAGYYLLSGRSLWDERVELLILTTEAYRSWVDDHYAERFADRDESEYEATLNRREEIKSLHGFKTRDDGKVVIIIDGGQPLGAVIDSVAHELGHMQQDFMHPLQSEASRAFLLDAVQEGQAQQYERAFWLAVEEFTGRPVLSYPDYASYRGFLDERLDFLVGSAYSDEHLMGFVIQWMVVLNDSELSDLRTELQSTGRLGRQSAYRLFEHLVGLAPEAVEGYASEMIKGMSDLPDVAAPLSKMRLIAGMDPNLEGPPNLRFQALLTP